MNYDLVIRKRKADNGKYKRPKYQVVRELGPCKNVESARELGVLAMHQIKRSGDPRYNILARNEIADYDKNRNTYLPADGEVIDFFGIRELRGARFGLMDENGETYHLWIDSFSWT